MHGSEIQLPDVSVVIPTRNRARLLREVVESLAVQQGIDAGRLEVVVVDDGSLDAAEAALSPLALPFPLRVLRQPHCGVASARNAGWSAARGEVILFLDDDVVPAPEFAAAHMAVHAVNPSAVVLGAVSSHPARRREAWNAYEDAIRAGKYRALAGQEIPSGIHYGGNFSVRRGHLESAGGFDQKLVANHDIDLGFRFRQMGLDFVFEPAATGVHCGGRDLETWRLMHLIRGRFDVAMFRDRGYAGGLLSLVACYHDRNSLIRLAVRIALLTHRMEHRVVDAGIAIGTAAHRLRMGRISRAAMSMSANVLYWAAVRDGLRGNRQLWELVRRTQRYTGRPYELSSSRT